MISEHDERPWGTYTVVDETDTHKVKRISVAPGKRLSYQRHQYRAEHWFVVQGSGQVILDDDVIDVEAGTAVDIPAKAAHRIHNTGTDELVFIEVQHGSSFDENDIERLQDDYGRAE